MRRHLKPLLLIASLLFGVWTSATHDADHAAAGAHADVCALCAFAGAAGNGLAANALALLFAACTLRFAQPSQTAPRLARRAAVRVRGPPARLA